MNILFITDLYPVFENETHTPKTLYIFVKKWQEFGHNVQILKPNFLFNSFLRRKKIYKSGKYGDVYNVNYVTPFLFDVKRKLPKYEYDVIVAHMPSGIIFSNNFKGKLVCAVHSSDIDVLTNPVYKFYFKTQMEKAYKRAEKIACRSQVLKDKFLKLYPQYEDKIILCESGIDFEPILRVSNKRKKIVTCANLIKRKNVDKLILAINDFPELELTVIGSGKELNYLKSISKGNIKFVGQKSNQEVLEIMKNSDIFILPSEKETFGMVYLEAMACNCITVCTKNDGIDGIIQDGINGFSTLPTVDAIKETLNKILLLPETELSILLQNCYNTLSAYNSKDCADRYLQNIFKIV